MHNYLFVALFAVISLFILTAQAPGAQSANVVATVNVFCNFKVSLLSTNSMYVLPLTSDISIGYSIMQTNGCLIPSMPGFLNITNQVNYLLSTNSVTYPPHNGTVPIPYSIFENVTHESYTASLALTYANFTNQSDYVFQVVQPAILYLNGFSATSGAAQGSQITIYQNVSRKGFLAPSNMLLHTQITGPGPTSLSINTPIPSIGLFSFTENNASLHAGTYRIRENLTYFNGAVYASTNTIEYNYTVVSPSQPSGGGGGGGGASSLPKPPSNISSVYFTNIPVLSGMLVGASSVSQIGMANKGSFPVWVNLTVPTKSAIGSIVLSSTSVYMQPHTSLSVNIAYFIAANAVPGSYVVPINVSVTPQGAFMPSKQSLFLTVSVSPAVSQSPQIITSFIMQNSSSVSGSILLVNKLNRSIYNATLQMKIPRSAASLSSISLAGAPSRLVETNDSYILSWNISNVSKGDNFVYYTISNVTKPQLILSPSTTFSVPTNEKSALTVFSILMPTFYTNTTNNISVESFYTGTRESNITFTLASVSGVKISNASQSIAAQPNTYVNQTFLIHKIPKSGTYLFTLFISGDGVNQSYSLPAVVISSASGSTPESLDTRTTTIPQIQSGISINLEKYLAVFAYTIAAVFAVILLLLVRTKRRGSRYHRERAKNLEELKEHIKRSDQRID